MRTTVTTIALLAVMAAGAQTIKGRVYSQSYTEITAGSPSVRVTQRDNGTFRAEGTQGEPIVLIFSAANCRTKRITVPAEVLDDHRVSMTVTMEQGSDVSAIMTEDQYGILRATPQ